MMLSDEELAKDKAYFKNKRKQTLERLNEKIEQRDTYGMEEAWNNFFRAHKQWVLSDDALAVYKLTHEPRTK